LVQQGQWILLHSAELSAESCQDSTDTYNYTECLSCAGQYEAAYPDAQDTGYAITPLRPANHLPLQYIAQIMMREAILKKYIQFLLWSHHTSLTLE
jgi:hypothetical protein